MLIVTRAFLQNMKSVGKQIQFLGVEGNSLKMKQFCHELGKQRNFLKIIRYKNGHNQNLKKQAS